MTGVRMVQANETPKRITGTQEDFDLVLADDRHLVLIEAKAHGAWDQAQFNAKLKRFEALRDLAGERLKVNFLLMSHHKPGKLKIPGGFEKYWLPLEINGKLASYRVMRCDAQGKIGKDGGHWTLVEKPAAEPAEEAEA